MERWKNATTINIVYFQIPIRIRKIHSKEFSERKNKIFPPQPQWYRRSAE